jgi:nitroreductase
MEILDQLNWRYACKKFDTEKKLSPEQVDTLVKAFNLTATSYGLQPMKLQVITNTDLREKLFANSFNQAQVKDASHLFVIAAKTNMNQSDIDAYFDLIDDLRATPKELIAPYRAHLTNWVASESENNMDIWARKQTYIALGNLLNVCAVIGVDSCPMEGFDANAYDEILNLKETDYTTSLVLPVGFRHEEDFMSQLKKVRMEESKIVSFIE